MHAEIIAVGSELTTGAKLDTNSQWLSLELAEIGIPVRLHTTMADDLAAMVDVLRAAAERSDVVLISGGLGPTLDDLTRQALAELAGTPLVLHQESLDFIRSLFARRGREMPERNVLQAMFPQGSEPIVNPRGTAPGIWLERARPGRDPCRLAALPGVPHEMKRMFLEEVRPRLHGSGDVIRRARVNCFGVGESRAEEMLGDLTARGGDPDVGITAHEATITLRITAQGRTADECAAKIGRVRRSIRERMGHYVFGEEDEELEDVLIRLLLERGQTLATAESGTGGLMAQRLTGVPGFQAAYLGGLIVPTDAARHNLLDVDRELLQTAGAISGEVAAAMAEGCRARMGTDYALAVTEWPRVDVDEIRSSDPRTFVALAGAGLLEVREEILFGDPTLNRSRTAKAALNLLRLHLLR